MNKQAKERALFAAISDIDPALIEEAATPPVRTIRNRLVRLGAMAAVLALLLTGLLWLPKPMDSHNIISAPGGLRVYASDLDYSDIAELSKYELNDAVDSYRGIVVPYTNFGGAPLPILFCFPNELYPNAHISINVSVEHGTFFTKKDGTVADCGSSIQVNNGEKVYWSHGSVEEARELYGSGGMFYASIILYADNNIVGYGIIDFVFYDPDLPGGRPSYVTDRLTAVCFPMVDGEYQNVPESYVWEKIAEHKAQ